MFNSGEMLICLLGNEVCGNILSLPSEPPYSDDFLIDLFNLSKLHDVSHVAGSALISNKLLSDGMISEQFRNSVYSTAFRYEYLCHATEKVCKVLENENIPYILLKGAVLKNYYPQAWMRTGCDVDILVKEKDVDYAAKKITETLGYEHKGKGKHDIQILSTENIYIELHFSLLEEKASPEMARVLDKVWDYAKPVADSCEYVLDDSMFFFYHIAHMAKHFIKGGCGIRPFLDLFLMVNSKDYHTSETKALLKKGKLYEFSKTAEKLSRVWFSDEEHDEVTRLMEEFIFSGGCFGTKETRMLSAQQRAGGRIKHLLSRVFVPYDYLKNQYPIIKKYKFLTPFCEICRLFSLIFGKKKKFRKIYVGKLSDVSDEHIYNINLLFESVNIK